MSYILYICLLYVTYFWWWCTKAKYSIFDCLFPVSAAERRKCPEPALWRSWTMGWSAQREQITAISLWTSWACGPSFLFSWKPPRRWRKLVLQRKNMKVSHSEVQSNFRQDMEYIHATLCWPVKAVWSVDPSSTRGEQMKCFNRLQTTRVKMWTLSLWQGALPCTLNLRHICN